MTAYSHGKWPFYRARLLRGEITQGDAPASLGVAQYDLPDVAKGGALEAPRFSVRNEAFCGGEALCTRKSFSITAESLMAVAGAWPWLSLRCISC